VAGLEAINSAPRRTASRLNPLHKGVVLVHSGWLANFAHAVL
jgi:hypothetical protein